MEKRLPLIAAMAVLCLFSYSQTILGVDVAHYDSDAPYGAENWTQVKGAGKKFAWNKATQGISYTDPSFVTNMVGGHAAGVVMGAYHFATPETNSATAEANWFVSVAGAYIGPGYLPPVLDLEDPSSGTGLTSYFTSAALTTWVQTWMTTVQNATGVAPIIYTSGSIASYVGSSLNHYGLWSADPDGSSTVAPNAAHLGVWTTWKFKQYSWTGTVAGIGSNSSAQVDLDVFNGDTTAFNTLIGIATTANFSANVTTGCPGMQVTFTDHSTTTGTITGYRWTFTGGSPTSATASNPTVTYGAAGNYSVKEVIISSTGTDSITKAAYIRVIPDSTLPLSQSFQGSTFPPAGWTMNFPSPVDSAWQLCTNNGKNSTHCMYFPANCGYTNSTAGQRQQIYTPNYSFVGTSNPKLWFDVAYEPYNRVYSDTLAIYYSLDCANTWNLIYLKGGMTLCSTGGTDSAGVDTSGGRGCFIPPNSAAWRTDTISLSSLVGDADVMFSFESRSGWGNILYIDNINVASPVVCTPPATPTIQASPGTTACSSVQLTASSSGCTGCTYSWSNNATGAVVSVTSSGNYNVTAISAGCASSPGTVAVTVNQPPTVNASASSQQACVNQSVTLTATGNGTSYQWSGTGLQTTTGSSVNAVVSSIGSQTYIVTATLNGCTATASASVNFNSPPATPSISASPGLTACGPIQLTASSAACVGCVYNWSNSASGTVISATSTGTYSLTATSCSCASSPTSVSVTVNTSPTVSATASSQQVCTNQSVTLTASGNGASYQWSGSGLQTSNSSSVTAIVSSSGSQTYVVTATLNSCTATASTSVNFNSPPATPSINASPGLTACGPIQLTASSPACSGCSYSWSNLSSGSIISVSSTGSYDVTATNGGCTSSPTSVAVTVNQAPTVSINSSSQQVCVNQAVTLTATGTGSTYQWGGAGLQASTGGIVSAIVASAGLQTYNVTATLNNCTATASTSVNFSAGITPNINITQSTSNPICNGSSVNFSSSSTNGGSGPVYQWSASNGQAATGNSFTLTNAANGITVRCLLISNASCASPDSVYSNTLTVVTASPQPTTLTISTPDTNVCSGENIVFTSISGNGGSNPTYSWYQNGTATGGGSSFAVNNIQSNTAVYCVMTSSSSCVTGSPVTSNIMNVRIQNTAVASVSIAANQNPVCAGTPVTFTATPGNGGASPTYTWRLNGNVVGSNSTTYLNPSPQNVDVVTCSMVSTASCVGVPNVVSNTITMAVNPLPIANAGTTFYVPSSSSVILGGNPTATGGTSPYTYYWAPSNGLSSSTIANPIENGITSGTLYAVTVTDANHCSASDTVGVYLIQCALVIPTVQVNLCELAAQNIPAVSYQWYLQGNIISGATTRFYGASQNGYYFVKINDQVGCNAQSPDVYISYPACQTSGIENVGQQPAFEVYPNPMNNEVSVSFMNAANGNTLIEIVDLVGQTIYRSDNLNVSVGFKYTINTSSFASGPYLVKVFSGGGRFAVKSLIKL